jgi:SpoIID/LytB domain protein
MLSFNMGFNIISGSIGCVSPSSLPSWKRGGKIAVTVFCLLGVATPAGSANPNADVELQVGIVQRFGEKPTDELTLEATEGDRLTLRFLAGNLQPQTINTDKVKLEITMQPQPQPVLEERVVLGTYPNFETAEDHSLQWRKLGIETEVAQPGRWQVWAKRDVYSTPLLRRLLLESVKAKGKNAFIETQVLDKLPRVSWSANGFRFTRTELDITAGKNTIRVSQGKDKRPSRLFVGPLNIQRNAYQNFTLVNRVPLETYLRGVVPNEIGASAPVAALEAQAILARTYALRNLRRFAIDNYQLCADVHCQVYFGLSGATPTTDQAIASTRGMVLTYNNELVDALYSSTTGGVTASFSDVWNGPDRPYLRPVVDASSNVWDLSKKSLADEKNFRQFISLEKGFNEDRWEMFRWRKESNMQGIINHLREYLTNRRHPLADFTSIQQMQITERSPGGRILEMIVTTDKGELKLHKEEVRSAFLPPRSTFFYIEPVKRNNALWGYAFIGGGFGHGVGLSQTGAYKLAELGWSSEKILNFYFPETQLQPLNNSLVYWQQPS